MSKSMLYDRLIDQLTDFGKVKIGELVEGQRKPKKLDYFKVIDLNNNIYAPVHEAYGPKPTSLIVQFMYDGDSPKEIIQNNFRLFMAQYWPSDIFERCIGVCGEARRVWNRKGVKENSHCEQIVSKFSTDGTLKGLNEFIECPEMGCYFAKDHMGPDGKVIPAKCKMRCNVPLTILHPETFEPIPNVIGGVFRLRTTGFHTIKGMINSANTIFSQTPGNIFAGIPLKMTLEFIKATTKNYEIPRILLTTLGGKKELCETIDKLGTFRISLTANAFDAKEEIELIETAEEHDLEEIKHEFTPAPDSPVSSAASPAVSTPAAAASSDPLGDALKATGIELPKAEVVEAAKAAELTAPAKPKPAKKAKPEPPADDEEPEWMKGQPEPPIDDDGAF